MLTGDETYTMRGGGATKKLFVALFVALLTALTLTPPAFGAVNEPPDHRGRLRDRFRSPRSATRQTRMSAST